MDDWLFLLGGSLAGMAGIALFYWLYNRSDESEFDTKYPRENLHLLQETQRNQKGQQSGGNNNKKNKNKKADNKQPVAQQPAQAPKNGQNKQQQQQKPSPPQPQPEKAKVEVAEAPVEAPAVQQQAQPVQAEAPPRKAPQPPKPVNSSDLDQKKVMSYLSKKGDIDSAYISWLTAAFQSHETQLNNRKMETQSLDKKNRDLVQKNEKLQKDKTAADNRAKEEQTQRMSVAAKLQAAQSRETELARQHQASQAALQNRDAEQGKELGALRSRNQQIESELNNVRSNLNRANATLRSTQQQLRDVQHHADEQAKKHQSVVAAYEADKTKTANSVAELNKVVEFCELELSKTGNQFTEQAQQINSLSTANKELENALQAAHLALANQSKHNHEGTAKLEEEQKQWLAEKAQMTEKYVRLEELIKELNSDMNEFHLYKDQQEKIVSELNQRDQARLDELAKEKAKEADLVKQLEETKNKLAEVRKKLDEETARIVEIPKNSEPVEEVFELKKTNVDLAAAPSTSSSDVEELKAKNAELEEKNTELRQRNMAILEKTEAIPNQLVSARKQVAAELGKLTKKTLKAFNDEEAFHGWLSESVSDIEKSLTSKAAVSAPAPAQKTPKAQAAPQQAPAQKAPSGNEQVCRTALLGLIKELDHIQNLVDKQERKHEAELAQLRAQLA